MLSAVLLQAQPYYFKHYQVENGLSNNTVFTSVQDAYGFMWFGTRDGLNRFDGYTFKTYRYDPCIPGSLGNDKIYTLAADKDGSVWVGTERGLYHYNPLYETFTRIKETLDMGVNYIRITPDGKIWISIAGRIYRYDKIKKTFSKQINDASFVSTHLYCTPGGELLISNPDGNIAAYDPATETFRYKYIPDRKPNELTGWITSMIQTSDGQLILGTNNRGVKLYNPKTNTIKNLLIFNKDKTHIYVRDMQARTPDEFWIGTESGIYIYNHRTGTTTHLQKEYSNRYNLSDNAIYTVSADKDGGIWMGTYFGGVNYYAPTLSVFTKYFPQQQQNSISGSDIREICKDKNGNFWIGTEDAGLNKLDPQTGHFTTYFPTGTASTIAHSNVHGLLCDGNKLWIGTFEHGIDIMDIRTGLITKHYEAGKGNALRSNFALSFLKTQSGVILIGTTSGLYQYNPKTDDFDAVPGLPFLFFNNVKQSSDGYIWAGTYNDGLLRFRLGEPGYKQFKHQQQDKKSLGHNIVNGIFEDSKHNIWIATDGGGFSCFHQKEENFSTFTIKEGLPSNFIFRILEDQDQKLWLSTTRGLVCFNPENKTFKTYTRADGLLTDQFNYNSAFKDTDGRMFFGSVKGMISFFPQQLNTTSKTVPLFLTGFQIDNTISQGNKADTALNLSLLHTNQITLNHNQSSFSIDFAALGYISPETTEYAYKMTGLYNNWEYLKTNRKVYFTKLAPGTYIFEAKAMVSGSNQWSKKNIRLKITILPPFWKTGTAYFLYTLLLLGSIAGLIWQYHLQTERRHKRKMERFEHEKEKEIYQAKIEFFTNVAHEIRTPLTLIKGPMEKLIKTASALPQIEKNLMTMNRNTDRLLNLTNQLLDFRKTEINGFSLNFVKCNISALIADVALQFQFAAEQHNLKYDVELPEKALYAYVDMEALYKIMSNLIDNAIKYGKSTIQIRLSIEKEKDLFNIQVSNNGIKIPVELKHKIFEPFFRAKAGEMKPGSGIGLSISRSLAELHNGKLFLEENNNDYNTFILSLPIHQTIAFNLDGKWKKN